MITWNVANNENDEKQGQMAERYDLGGHHLSFLALGLE